VHRDVSKKDENVALHTVVSKAETTTLPGFSTFGGIWKVFFFGGGIFPPEMPRINTAGWRLSRPTIVYDGDQTGTPDGVSYYLPCSFLQLSIFKTLVHFIIHDVILPNLIN